jgi:hypothetical protein
MTGRLPGGMCPACLVALALQADDDPGDLTMPVDRPPAYRVLTVLSGEADRTTYLAQPEGRRGLVALEVVGAAALSGLTPDGMDRRIAAIRRLRHQGVVRVLEAWATGEGGCCVVSEYVPGQMLARMDADDATACTVFDDLCAAIAAMHEDAVAHGRLQPSSVVLVRKAGRLVPRITGVTVCASEPEPRNDVAGLGRVLAGIAARVPLPPEVGEVVRCAIGERPGGEYAAVEDLHAAFRAAVLRPEP